MSLRHLRTIDDLRASELSAVLSRAAEIKTAHQQGDAKDTLERQTLGMVFQKPSTRTRVSFETGMTQLGGHAIFLGADDIQLGRGEPIKDTARALSGYVDFIMARLFDHSELEELAAYATVPVINGLTDDAHPCQSLADLLTIRERHDDLSEVTAAWIGDGNNVAHSFILGCAMTGVDLRVAAPEGYGPDTAIIERAGELGPAPTVTTDPQAAADGADVVYTDVWVSMGQEDERDERLAAFEDFQVNRSLLKVTNEADVMHCLPANRGEEITDAVIESEQSVVWQQAENRLHAQKGLLAWLADQSA